MSIRDDAGVRTMVASFCMLHRGIDRDLLWKLLEYAREYGRGEGIADAADALGYSHTLRVLRNQIGAIQK